MTGSPLRHKVQVSVESAREYGPRPVGRIRCARARKTVGVLPNKDHTFHWQRPVTILEHIIDDYENQTAEDDFTHVDEILKLHDLSKDLPAGNPEQFRSRSANNAAVRRCRSCLAPAGLTLAPLTEPRAAKATSAKWTTR
jgi:hypothetical protein